jgi:hypothetical protein
METVTLEGLRSQASRCTRPGEWIFSSGQCMICDREHAGRDGLRHVRCAWGVPPPLPPENHAYSVVTVRRALIRAGVPRNTRQGLGADVSARALSSPRPPRAEHSTPA